MDNKRKKYIDALWRNTLCGKFIIAAAKGNDAEAEQIRKEIFKEYPFFVSEAEKLLADEMKKELQQGEFIEYLKILEKEEPDILHYLYTNSTLYDELLLTN